MSIATHVLVLMPILETDIPPQPKAILRGHSAQVHAAAFIRSNQRLVTGDADGFVVVWDLAVMRPRAVWRAHENAILGIAEWPPASDGDSNNSKIVITHGRDNRLVVWKLAAEDEALMSTLLPLHAVSEPRIKPWMLHLLPVNTLNFCSFACCSAGPTVSHSTVSELLLAVPNTLTSEAVDVYGLPSQTRLHTVDLGQGNGMAMALNLVWLSDVLTLVAGYENGVAAVVQLGLGSWTTIYRAQSHLQPILSLDVAPNLTYFLTSSADAFIVKHPLPSQEQCLLTNVTEQGTDAVNAHVACEETDSAQGQRPEPGVEKRAPVSTLSSALARHIGISSSRKPAWTTIEQHIQTQPIKIANTKHPGQQGLKIRSDGRIFATAGWDSTIRVYSAKSMREVAVLKWHSVGCFAVAFADVTAPNSTGIPTVPSSNSQQDETSFETSVISSMSNTTVKNRRINHARTAHWLAAGSKDGKVSLWDVF